jgi:predicted nucleic acid-binding protein
MATPATPRTHRSLPTAAYGGVEPNEADIVRDPGDNRLIEAAVAVAADVMMSGGQDLVTFQGVGKVRIHDPSRLPRGRTRGMLSHSPRGPGLQSWA